MYRHYSLALLLCAEIKCEQTTLTQLRAHPSNIKPCMCRVYLARHSHVCMCVHKLHSAMSSLMFSPFSRTQHILATTSL